jgi:cysteine synthase
MSLERVALLRQLGAEVVLTPGILMIDVVAKAVKIATDLPGTITLDQFKNPANPEIHRRTTAVEIWNDTQGEIDCFVSAIGTGGTITGVGEFLKQRKPGVRIIGVEPAGAAILSGGRAGNHQIPGIGVGFVPEVLSVSVLDELIAVTDEDAFSCARWLARDDCRRTATQITRLTWTANRNGREYRQVDALADDAVFMRRTASSVVQTAFAMKRQLTIAAS